MRLEATNMWFGALVLIGGLGLFLYGMLMMTEGLQLAAGDRMRKMLEKLTGGRVRGVLVGTGVTALIQSSSATTVMLVGFVNAGLMAFAQSVAVILGANIGTTITAQIVAFKVQTLAFPLIGIGFVMFMVGNKKTVKYTGQVLLGLGILFLGMELMKAAMHPLKESGAFEHWISSYGSHWLLGLLLGMIITSIIQSSSATTAIVIAMGAGGALGGDPTAALNIAIPIILGCNIGTCVTAFIASIGTSLPAQRVAVAHYLINITGVLIVLPFLHWFPDLVRAVSELFGSGADDIARQIAWSHTIFNVGITLLLLPFLNQFVKLVKVIRKGAEPTAQRDPLFLDPKIFHGADIAFEMARKEISRMANISLEMLKTSVGFMKKLDRTGKKNLLEEESIVDNLASTITSYLTRVSQETLTDEQSELMVGLMHAVNDIERIGDHAENIMYLAATKQENAFQFRETEKGELEAISSKVFDMYEGIIAAFEGSNPEEAARFQTLEHEVDQMASRYRRNHIIRLNMGKYPPGAGVIFLDTLSNLERVGDLANNVGHVVAGELGRL
ncbi:MAG: Na/Pi cotransporter family protein [Actinobacteria bacterium]|nr:Na/Pi cotransporter family protein [Actinomycetota bacterium]MCG2817484.1 Na/Pi cotransporter family protein [Actinomycetes bacterium]MBU4217968.1 Na/Pi cotransporter family protein [Actinomycetota bacterium]MBU4357918.1 Na/Pi cotransporter family protein [Actinomycetota bacterium]MBU4402154.1 Na/Pi cotransporter family protein [Actinomycetota bacterium]